MGPKVKCIDIAKDDKLTEDGFHYDSKHFLCTEKQKGERRNQQERGREGGREGKRERRARREKEVWNRERKGGRKCIMLDDTCVSVVLDRNPCCLPYRWRSYSSAVVSLHSSVWLAHAGYHLMKVEEKRYEQMVGGSL